MNQETINQLNDINRKFYEVTAAEFDQTRGTAWSGWMGFLPELSTPLSVLDAGCGNGRFGVFLSDHLQGKISYQGLDNNAQLLQYAASSLKNHANIAAQFIEHDIITQPLPEEQADLVVLFGVIHHVPGAEARKRFMQSLAEHIKPDGLLIFAAWRFYEYDRFKKRVVAWDADLAVEDHDYLLDWRRGERALRYCHYVDDREHDELVAATGLTEINRYRADGFTGEVNNYSVLRKA